MNYRSSMMILRTIKCPFSCMFCGYHNDIQNITSEVPSPEEMLLQTLAFIEKKKEAVEKNKELYIVNSGSFFSHQVPRQYMHSLSEFLKEKDWGLIVDSRADSRLGDYAGEISELVSAVPKLTIALGLEIADDDVLKRLKKGCALDQYLQASKRIRSLGAALKSYVLIAPPLIGEPPYKGRAYADLAIEKTFSTVKFAVEEMGSERIGISPCFPYKGTELRKDFFNEGIWVPMSPTECAEIVNQLKQVYPKAAFDYTSRQIHFPYYQRAENPINTKDPKQVLSARENVAEISKKVLGTRGDISARIWK